MATRREAREIALQILFQFEFLHTLDVAQSLDLYRAAFAPHLLSYTEKLVVGIRAHLTEIDAKIGACSRHWKISRMALVDLNVIRIAVFELCFCQDEVPSKVAINEAIEIAKHYGSTDSASFANGILDQIAQRGDRSENIN